MPLFPTNEPVQIQQGRGGSCYLLAFLYLACNQSPQFKQLIKSRFKEVNDANGYHVELSVNLSPKLKYFLQRPERLNRLDERCVYIEEGSQARFIIPNARLEEIDRATGGGSQSNSLAIKILERMAPFFFDSGWESEGENPDDQYLSRTISAHCGNNRFGDDHQFLSQLFSAYYQESRSIDDLIKLKAIDSRRLIYLAINWGAPGSLHARHAVILEEIRPLAGGDYQFIFRNPHDTTRLEAINLRGPDGIYQRNLRFCVFSESEIQNRLTEIILSTPKKYGDYIFRRQDIFIPLIEKQLFKNNPFASKAFFAFLVNCFQIMPDFETIYFGLLQNNIEDFTAFYTKEARTNPRTIDIRKYLIPRILSELNAVNLSIAGNTKEDIQRELNEKTDELRRVLNKPYYRQVKNFTCVVERFEQCSRLLWFRAEHAKLLLDVRGIEGSFDDAIIDTSYENTKKERILARLRDIYAETSRLVNTSQDLSTEQKNIMLEDFAQICREKDKRISDRASNRCAAINQLQEYQSTIEKLPCSLDRCRGIEELNTAVEHFMRSLNAFRDTNDLRTIGEVLGADFVSRTIEQSLDKRRSAFESVASELRQRLEGAHRRLNQSLNTILSLDITFDETQTHEEVRERRQALTQCLNELCDTDKLITVKNELTPQTVAFEVEKARKEKSIQITHAATARKEAIDKGALRHFLEEIDFEAHLEKIKNLIDSFKLKHPNDPLSDCTEPFYQQLLTLPQTSANKERFKNGYRDAAHTCLNALSKYRGRFSGFLVAMIDLIASFLSKLGAQQYSNQLKLFMPSTRLAREIDAARTMFCESAVYAASS